MRGSACGGVRVLWRGCWSSCSSRHPGRLPARRRRPDSPPSVSQAESGSDPANTPTPEHGQAAGASPPRACEGCPERHLWRPYLESTGLNVLYNMGNRMRGHETAVSALVLVREHEAWLRVG